MLILLLFISHSFLLIPIENSRFRTIPPFCNPTPSFLPFLFLDHEDTPQPRVSLALRVQTVFGARIVFQGTSSFSRREFLYINYHHETYFLWRRDGLIISPEVLNESSISNMYCMYAPRDWSLHGHRKKINYFWMCFLVYLSDQMHWV